MKKCMTDLAAGCICLAAFGIAWIYPEQVRYQDNILWISAIAAVVCFCMAFLDQIREKMHSDGSSEVSGTEPDVAGMVTELVLLSEEDTELMVWNLYGRISGAYTRKHRQQTEKALPYECRLFPFALESGSLRRIPDLRSGLLVRL